MQPGDLERFLETPDPVVRIAIVDVRGSAPREAGTEMYVSADARLGTIGGGQVEHMAIAAARAMLEDGTVATELDVPLGPEIGQCCGGRVGISLSRMRETDRQAALARARAEAGAWPHVYVLGAGHVGRALATQFQHLPVRCVLVDGRAQEIALCDADVETRLSALPEADIVSAPAGSAFVVLTHEHGLDFLLTAAALKRADAAYVGLIGSATKRARFASWLRENEETVPVDRLICPIGAHGSRDKRPAVIAAFVVAEVMAELSANGAVLAGDRMVLSDNAQTLKGMRA